MPAVEQSVAGGRLSHARADTEGRAPRQNGSAAPEFMLVVLMGTPPPCLSHTHNSRGAAIAMALRSGVRLLSSAGRAAGKEICHRERTGALRPRQAAWGAPVCGVRGLQDLTQVRTVQRQSLALTHTCLDTRRGAVFAHSMWCVWRLGVVVQVGSDMTTILGYDEFGFNVNGVFMRGSVICTPTSTYLWDCQTPADVNTSNLAVVAMVKPRIGTPAAHHTPRCA